MQIKWFKTFEKAFKKMNTIFFFCFVFFFSPYKLFFILGLDQNWRESGSLILVKYFKAEARRDNKCFIEKIINSENNKLTSDATVLYGFKLCLEYVGYKVHTWSLLQKILIIKGNKNSSKKLRVKHCIQVFEPPRGTLKNWTICKVL